MFGGYFALALPMGLRAAFLSPTTGCWSQAAASEGRERPCLEVPSLSLGLEKPQAPRSWLGGLQSPPDGVAGPG